MIEYIYIYIYIYIWYTIYDIWYSMNYIVYVTHMQVRPTTFFYDFLWPGRRCGQNGPQVLILSVLPAGAKMRPERISGSSFWALWRPGPRSGRNGPRKGNFEYFVSLGPDMPRMALRKLILSYLAGLGSDVARMGLRRLILSTLAAWAHIQNGSQKAYFEHVGGLAQTWPEWASEGFSIVDIICYIWYIIFYL